MPQPLTVTFMVNGVSIGEIGPQDDLTLGYQVALPSSTYTDGEALSVSAQVQDQAGNTCSTPTISINY